MVNRSLCKTPKSKGYFIASKTLMFIFSAVEYSVGYSFSI